MLAHTNAHTHTQMHTNTAHMSTELGGGGGGGGRGVENLLAVVGLKQMHPKSCQMSWWEFWLHLHHLHVYPPPPPPAQTVAFTTVLLPWRRILFKTFLQSPLHIPGKSLWGYMGGPIAKPRCRKWQNFNAILTAGRARTSGRAAANSF